MTAEISKLNEPQWFSDMSLDYPAVMAHVLTTNDKPFRGFDTGTLLLFRAGGMMVGKEWRVEYEFRTVEKSRCRPRSDFDLIRFSATE